MSKLANEDPEKFVGNPVNAFLMIKNLQKDLQMFVDDISNYHQTNSKNKLIKRLQNLNIFTISIELVDFIKENYMLPTIEDYNGAASALLRLEDTYNLKPSDIRKGNLSKQYPSRQLTGLSI